MPNPRPNHTRLIIILALIAVAIVAVFLILYISTTPKTPDALDPEPQTGQMQPQVEAAPEALYTDELPPPDSAPDPYATEFMSLVKEHGPIHSWPDENREDFLARVIEAGYLGSAPGETDDRDIPQEEAVQIARDTIKEVYGVTDEVLSTAQLYCVLNVVNPDKPVWQIDLLPEDVSQRGYTTYVLAHTGEVVIILSDENSNG